MSQDEELLARIDTAFQGIPAPKMTLRMARAEDDYVELDEAGWLKLYRADETGDWRKIPESDVIAYHDAFAFFGAEDFLFYIPAFMTFTVRHCANVKYRCCPVFDYTIYACSHSQQNYGLLTMQQAGVVRDFLYFYMDHGDEMDSNAAIDALEGYWDLAGSKSDSQN